MASAAVHTDAEEGYRKSQLTFSPRLVHGRFALLDAAASRT